MVHRTCLVLERAPRLVRFSDTPMGRFPPRTIKRGVHPLYWFGHSLDLKKLSTKDSWAPTLSLKLQSNPSLIEEIWAKSWVTLSIFKQDHFTNNLRVFVTLGDSSSRQTMCPSGATKVVVRPRKFVLSSPSWRFDSEEPNLILVIIRGGLWLRET
jgi:hypothetical protein